MKIIELEWLTELWWMCPPPSVIDKIYYQARDRVPRQSLDANRRQAYHARIRFEFDRLLLANGIYVEGM